MTEEVLVLTNDEFKHCPHCGRELKVSHFHKSSQTKDGYQSWCIECKREYNHQRSLFRVARRVGIHHQNISTILGTLKALSAGELTDTRMVFEEALKIVNNQIKSKKS